MWDVVEGTSPNHKYTATLILADAVLLPLLLNEGNNDLSELIAHQGVPPLFLDMELFSHMENDKQLCDYFKSKFDPDGTNDREEKYRRHINSLC